MKSFQKRKRQAVVKGEGANSTPQAKVSEGPSMAEQFGIAIPPASDFAAVLRVYGCAAQITEEMEDDPEFMLLKKKVKRVSAMNSDLVADLMDREDKLACCNEVMISGLLEENRLLRGQINSFSVAEAQIAEAEMKLSLGRAERVAAVEQELTSAQELEAEAESKLGSFREQVQQLESELAAREARLGQTKFLVFQRCQELVLVQDSDVDLDLLSLENEVKDGKVVRPRGDGEPEVLYDPSVEEEEEE